MRQPVDQLFCLAGSEERMDGGEQQETQYEQGMVVQDGVSRFFVAILMLIPACLRNHNVLYTASCLIEAWRGRNGCNYNIA